MRPLRLAVRALLLPAVVAVPARRAAAQPVCGTASLATYAQAGYVCDFEGFRFSGFSTGGQSSAISGPVSTVDIDPATLTLTPFRDGARVGFAFTNFAVSASVSGVSRLTYADAWLPRTLSFTFASGGVVNVLGGTGSYELAGARSHSTVLSSNAATFRIASLGGANCWQVGIGGTNPPVVTPAEGGTASGTCASSLFQGRVTLGVEALLTANVSSSRLTPARSGTASAELTEFAFVTDLPATTVPEPATVVLTAGGLLGVALAARRRRA